MAKLSLFFKNELLQSLELNEAEAYLVGRADNCNIILPAEPGISREHLRLSFVGGTWKVDVLSRYGELYQNEQKVSELVLRDRQSFEVPPFRFTFQDVEQLITHAESGFNDEHTTISQLPSVAQLKLFDTQGDVTQIYRLEGDAWVGGRETNCSIFIDNPKFSRRQFEIYRQDAAYYIRDAGSANGTLLNGQKLSVEAWAPLNSGDEIKVLDSSMQFELRDESYEKRLAEASPHLNAPMVIATPDYIPQMDAWPDAAAPEYQDEYYEEPPAPVASGPMARLQQIDWNKQNIFRAVILSIFLVGGLGYLTVGDSPAPTVAQPKSAKDNKSFEKLTAAKQEYVRESFRLAKEFYMQGRYEMARTEVIKVHQLVTNYEDSLDLQAKAESGIQLQAERFRMENEDKEKSEIENKIQRQLVICQKKINLQVEMRDIDECLSSVIQFNPEHAGIQRLKGEADQMIARRNMKDAQRAEYAQKVKRQREIYERAKSLDKGGMPLLALKAYQSVLESKLPDPQDYRAVSKRQIASIQKSLLGQQLELTSMSDQLYKKGDLKGAIISLKKAVQINPENNETKARVAGMLTELKKQMQTFYQEGILEESVGEVETAKNKWKKIREMSLPEEDYYKKATMKLKKYGAI